MFINYFLQLMMAQTQQVLVEPITKRHLPENLNLSIQFVSQKHTVIHCSPEKML